MNGQRWTLQVEIDDERGSAVQVTFDEAVGLFGWAMMLALAQDCKKLTVTIESPRSKD